MEFFSQSTLWLSLLLTPVLITPMSLQLYRHRGDYDLPYYYQQVDNKSWWLALFSVIISFLFYIGGAIFYFIYIFFLIKYYIFTLCLIGLIMLFAFFYPLDITQKVLTKTKKALISK